MFTLCRLLDLCLWASACGGSSRQVFRMLPGQEEKDDDSDKNIGSLAPISCNGMYS